MPVPHLDVVMTRFMESWDDILAFDSLLRLQNIPYCIIVYNKGEPINDNANMPSHIHVMQCPNIGRETYTIFHYIYHNYDTLPDIVMFMPASWNQGSFKRDIASKILREFKDSSIASLASVEWGRVYDNALDGWNGTTPSNIPHVKTQPFQRCAIRPFGKWYEARIGKPWPGRMVYCGMFSVHKPLILKHARQEYLTWLKEVEEYGVNSEIAHYWERAIASLFLD